MTGFDLRSWQIRWEQLSPRERAWVQWATLVLALALLWQMGLAPALRVWRESPARHAQLDRQHAQLAALRRRPATCKRNPHFLARKPSKRWRNSPVICCPAPNFRVRESSNG